MSNSIAITRLTEERKLWRKDHPFGFIAKPRTNPDGSANLLSWECGIPGKPDTAWEGGFYKVVLEFSEFYPASPPKCIFSPPIPHPNVFTSGSICLSIIGHGWKPSISVKQILLGIQELLGEPNIKSPANQDMYILYKEDRAAYEAKAKAFATRFKLQD